MLEFFNMRISGYDQWIGNIYCLDLGDQTGDLVIDHVQMPRSFDGQWLDFFPVLGRALIAATADTGIRRILLPDRISNHALIRDAFPHLVRTSPDLRRVGSILPTERDLHCFESASLAHWFVAIKTAPNLQH